MNEHTRSRTTGSGSRWSGLEPLYAAIADCTGVRQLLDTVVHRSADLFDSDSVVIFLEENGRLRPAAWVGLQPQLVQNGVPAPDRLRQYMDRFMAPSQCVQFMRAPLLAAEGRSLGELVVCSSRSGRPRYEHGDRKLLGLVARRVGESVDKIRAMEKAERQRSALGRIARALVRETELRKVAETATELAVAELDADAAAVWIADQENRVLELLAITGAATETVRSLERLDFDAPTMASVTATTREVQVVEGLDQMAELELTKSLFTLGGMQSGIDVPLIAQDKLMGVLSYVKKAPGRLVPGQQTLVITMADLLASAILNAQLFQEQIEARQKLEGLSTRLSGANEALVEANIRSAELASLAQQRAIELEAIIANIADAVFVCDQDGKILLINDAGLEMVGLDAKSGEFRTLKDYLAAARIRYLTGKVVPPEDLAVSQALRGKVVRGMEEIIFDAHAHRDRYIIVSAAPIRDQEGNLQGAVEVQSDITRLKELDQLKDQFITVAAHEIKTPVTAIKGFAQSLLRSPAVLDPKQRSALETIVRQSDRIDALVRDFLEISRMRRGPTKLSRERVDLTAMVGRVVRRMMPSTAKHQVDLSRGDPAWVEGEPDRLEEVVMNLLENAMRYSPRGGDVNVQVVRDGTKAIVSVRDNGVGIPEARRRNVFERFYRAHIGTPEDYGGLGVGLYISREIVRQHGGDMWFDTQEGKGSTFYFSLPLIDGEGAGGRQGMSTGETRGYGDGTRQDRQDEEG